MSISEIQILEHLKEFNPKTVKNLEKRGKLQSFLERESERATSVYQEAIDRGLAPDQAQELETQAWMPPEEPDRPGLQIPEKDRLPHLYMGLPPDGE